MLVKLTPDMLAAAASVRPTSQYTSRGRQSSGYSTIAAPFQHRCSKSVVAIGYDHVIVWHLIKICGPPLAIVSQEMSIYEACKYSTEASAEMMLKLCNIQLAEP